VGITVLVAIATLAVLIFLMTGTTGLFRKKLILHAYVDDAGGLRVGAPVRLEGVDIGNVTGIRVVSDPHRQLAPVEVTMKVTSKYSDSMSTGCQAMLATAGVLGEVYINIDCRSARGGTPLEDGAELKTIEVPQLEDVVRASQGTLQNVNVLVKQLSEILDEIQNGKGTIGKIIYDPTLYNRANDTIAQLQQVITQVNSPRGTIGKLINSDELYGKVNKAVDNVNQIIDEVNGGQGTIGKFIKDPALYNNANKMVANGNQLIADVNAGKGTLGKLAKDEALAKKIDDVITRLDNISERLDKGEGSAGKFLKDPSLYDNTNDLLVSTRDLIKAVRQNPKKYLTIYLKIF
jgi:phospholipid/cholesterol/gamma-HCH transport system substrate-binding protein